jgi:hypothetical protein
MPAIAAEASNGVEGGGGAAGSLSASAAAAAGSVAGGSSDFGLPQDARATPAANVTRILRFIPPSPFNPGGEDSRLLNAPP